MATIMTINANNNNYKLALITLVGLLVVCTARTYAQQQEVTASESVSVSETTTSSADDATPTGEDGTTLEEEETGEFDIFEEETLSLEDQLADLLMDHQDTRYECLQAKLMLDEATEADPELQASYDECMATLSEINDEMAALAEEIYAEELDSPFTEDMIEEDYMEEEDVISEETTTVSA